MLVEFPRSKEAPNIVYKTHSWELFRNPQPDYVAASWETEEQAQKNREGFVIATGCDHAALKTLADVFEPHEVCIRPRTTRRRGRKPKELQAVAAE